MRRGSSDAARTADGEPPGGAPIVNRSHIWFVAAGVFGTVHGLFSLYWASGGRWLLDTVGEWAIDLAESGNRAVLLGLGVLGVLKVLAAWLPPCPRRRSRSAQAGSASAGLGRCGRSHGVWSRQHRDGAGRPCWSDQRRRDRPPRPDGPRILAGSAVYAVGIALAAGLVLSRSSSR